MSAFLTEKTDMGEELDLQDVVNKAVQEGKAVLAWEGRPLSRPRATTPSRDVRRATSALS